MSRLLHWIPVLLWMGLIFWLSSQPQLPRLPEPLWQTLLAKTAHFGEYAVLAVLFLFALGGVSPGRAPNRRLLVLAAVLVYAISDEFHQGFVPNRTASLWDVLIDGAGALAALRWMRAGRRYPWMIGGQARGSS